jgi:hypothetical protein
MSLLSKEDTTQTMTMMIQEFRRFLVLLNTKQTRSNKIALGLKLLKRYQAVKVNGVRHLRPLNY